MGEMLTKTFVIAVVSFALTAAIYGYRRNHVEDFRTWMVCEGIPVVLSIFLVLSVVLWLLTRV